MSISKRRMKEQHHPSKQLKKGGVPWKLRYHIKPEDIEYLTHLHGLLYAKEYGYDQTFEAYVKSGLSEFVRSFHLDRDRLWVAEVDDHIIGTIAIVGYLKGEAQLRWFLVHPEYRGRGLGRKLIKVALSFCKRHKYRTIFLWTTSELDTARHLYASAGFRKTDEKTHVIWGKTVTEERYALQM